MLPIASKSGDPSTFPIKPEDFSLVLVRDGLRTEN
jgi:hypothetical protein